MEDESNPVESLLESAAVYSKTSFELLKLKGIDKTSVALSSIISRIAALIFICAFLLVGSTGIALWLGELLGKVWYGFFVVAVFYGIIGVVLYFFLHNWLKRQVGNFIIRQVLK